MSYITNKLSGNISVTGELLPNSNTYSLGSTTQTWGNLYVGTHSIWMSNPDPSVPPTQLSVNSANLLVIGRGGMAIRDDANTYDIFQVDDIGTVSIRSNVSASPTTPALNIIGNNTGSFALSVLGGSMLQITGNDGTISNVLNDSYGTGVWSAFIARHARGTAAVPLQILAGDIVARFGANPYGTTGFAPGAPARIDMFATENQTGTTRGSNVTISTTPNGSNVAARVATFDSAGIALVSNVLVGTDLTVTGNSIAYGTSTTYGNVISYGNLYSYGSGSTFGGLISTGNTQVNGDTQFSGNVIALKGIVFSDGSNITTAGVSAVTAGTGISITPGGGGSYGINNTGITSVAGTANQININQVGGAVTLSLPQDINTNSNPFFGNLTVGNLTVTGNISQQSQSDLLVTNKVIYAGNGATTTAAINEGGFVLGNSEIAVSMLYTASPPGWNFNTDLYPAGNVYIGGDLHSTTAYITSNVLIGVTPPVDFANANLQVTGTAPGTVQATVQNIDNGTGSSGDFVVTADTGDDATNYIDLGINSSTYNQAAYSAQKALDGYLYTSDGNLVISTANVTVSKQIVFTTGGVQTANVAGLISNGRWVLGPVDDGINKLQVAGTATFSGNVTAGNVTATGTITGATLVGTVAQASQTGITALGTLNSLSVSGGAGFASSLNVVGTSYAQNSITNASAFAQTLNVAGAATVNQLLSNLSITTGTITGSGTAQVNALISNTTVQSTGTLTAQSIISNAGMQSATLNVTGAAQVNSMTTNLLTTTNTLNIQGLTISNNLINNLNITTSTLNSSGLAQLNSAIANTSITTATLNTTGAAQVNSLIANASMFGQTLNTSGAAIHASVISNASIATATFNSSGLAQVGALYSNTSISTTSGIQAGTVTGNVSVTAPAVNATSGMWAQAFWSNTGVTSAGTVTAQSMISNSAITGQTLNLAGALQAGSMVSNSTIQATGNLTVSSVNANVSVHATNFYGTLTGTASTATNLAAATSILAGSLTVNPASIPKTSVATETYTLTGLTTNHKVNLTCGTALTYGMSITAAWASAADTLSVQYTNLSNGAIDLGNINLQYFAWV